MQLVGYDSAFHRCVHYADRHRMDHLQKLLIAGLLAAAGGAYAFTSPAPPPGFGGSPGGWTWSPPTAGQQLGGIMRGPGPSVAGSGPMGSAYKLGPGAARALARGVLGGGIAGAALLGGLWLAEHCFSKQNGVWVRTCGPGMPTYPQSTGLEWKTQGWNSSDAWFSTKEAACSAATAYLNSVSTNGATYTQHTCTTQRYSMTMTVNGSTYPDYQGVPMLSRNDTCPAGWYKTDAGCVQTPPPQVVPVEQIEDEMAEKPLPQTMPPGVPYPLDPSTPTIWNPTITNPPTTQPMRIPQGNPVPIPNTDPAQWRQPMTRVEHSPTSTEPWRMDTRPEDVITNSPTGQTGPETISGETPPGEPKEETEIDICKKNPDILACAKLDTPEGPDLEEQARGGPITPDSGWGAESATCPQPRILTVQGRQIPIPYTLFCTYMEGIRPLVIAMAWLSAGFILLGRKGGD